MENILGMVPRFVHLMFVGKLYSDSTIYGRQRLGHGHAFSLRQ